MEEIQNLIKQENCFIIDQVEDWRQAVDVSLEPLIKGGYCTEVYKQAVYDNLKKYGPYFVICEDLALVHADGKKGVNKSQLSITVLKEPVKFEGSKYNVRILIALAAGDSVSHMAGIKAVANIFIAPEKVEKLLKVDNGKELYDMFIESSKEEV